MPAIKDIPFGQHEKFDDWWISDPVEIPYFDDLSLSIRIVDLTIDDLVDDQFAEDISQAVIGFLGLSNSERLSVIDQVFQNYKENELYCRFLPRLLLGKSQLWHYCEPQYITVLRYHEDQRIYLVVSFKCEWEMEHGMSFVFQNGIQLHRVGADDGHVHSPSDYWRKKVERESADKTAGD